MGEAVNGHGRDESSVVGILADNWRSGDKSLPDPIDKRRVIEPEEQTFEIREVQEGLGGGFPETVYAYRASGDDPELIKILRHDVKLMALLDKQRNGIKGLLMHGVSWVGHPRQEYWYQPDNSFAATGVDALAAVIHCGGTDGQ